MNEVRLEAQDVNQQGAMLMSKGASEPIRVACYCRVATEAQAHDTLEMQKDTPHVSGAFGKKDCG